MHLVLFGKIVCTNLKTEKVFVRSLAHSGHYHCKVTYNLGAGSVGNWMSANGTAIRPMNRTNLLHLGYLPKVRPWSCLCLHPLADDQKGCFGKSEVELAK